ncbi:MAG: hypothetical protein RXO25_02320 [Caldivirga sp.]|jgi:hypothetical protein
MEDRLVAIIEALRVMSDGRWVSLRSIRRRVPINMSLKDLLELSRRGLVESYVDLASGEIYIRVKPSGSSGSGINITELVKLIKNELKEPMPKPAFEELLRRVMGDMWTQAYSELVNRGIVRELDFNGITFLALVRDGQGQAQ